MWSSFLSFLMFPATFKAIDCALQENLFSSLFSHTNTSPSNPFPDSPLHFNTAVPSMTSVSTKPRWTTKDQGYLFHFPLPTLIHSNKANKQFYAQQRFYPYKTLNLVSDDAPLALERVKGKLHKDHSRQERPEELCQCRERTEQQLLGTSNIFFSLAEMGQL